MHDHTRCCYRDDERLGHRCKNGRHGLARFGVVIRIMIIDNATTSRCVCRSCDGIAVYSSLELQQAELQLSNLLLELHRRCHLGPNEDCLDNVTVARDFHC